MTNIFLLNEPQLPQHQLITGTLADYYTVREFHAWIKLEVALKNAKSGVVVFSAPASKVNSQAAEIKAAMPNAACICVMSQDEADKITGTSFDVDFLLEPATRLDILSRFSTAARQTELLHSLSEEGQLDEVTQLYNRRYFINRLNEEISLCKRHMSPLTCMVVGLDGYKLLLDSYGYDFISGLLRHLAVVVEQHKRTEDIMARIGDDEVALLLPRSTEKGALPLAKRIIETIGATPYQSGTISEEITVNIGAVAYPVMTDYDAPDADADALIRYARHALHNARKSDEKALQLFSEIQPVL